MSSTKRKQLQVEDYVEGVLQKNRTILARTITLLESTQPKHREKALQVLEACLPYAGNAHRVGITGIPGAGKSTFLEAMGMHLLEQDHHIAVLTIDPTSPIHGGSILGDKTRMAELSRQENAFIRPSPTKGTLGGVHRNTREAMLVCEAAGFDVIFVETVGVGQSEYSVSDMVDTFVVLMLAGTGDSLQGIKKGILELADIFVFNKADGDRKISTRRAQIELKRNIELVKLYDDWVPPVLSCSSLEKMGIEEVWTEICSHKTLLKKQNEFENVRQIQQEKWMWSLIESELLHAFKQDKTIQNSLPSIEKQIMKDAISVPKAVQKLLNIFLNNEKSP